MTEDEINRRMWREPNPETLAELKRLAATWRAGVKASKELRQELDERVVAAFDEGMSYRQIKEATGLSTSTIQIILARAGLA